MKYFYTGSNKEYNIYFTDGVFEKHISELDNSKMADLITNLLNDAYSNGLKDGGLLYLKTKYPHIYAKEIDQYFKSYKDNS